MSDPAPPASSLACCRCLQVRSRALKSSFSSSGTGGGGWRVGGIRRRAKSEVEESAGFAAAEPDSARDRVGNLGENIVLKTNTLQRGLSLLSESESLETSLRETVTMLREDHCVLGHQASQGGDLRGDGEKEGAEAMETWVAVMEETGDERTRPGEGKAISIVTPRSLLHPSPDFTEVQHPDPASGKALQSADLPPARGATGPHTPAYHSLSSGRVLFPTPPCYLRFYFSQVPPSHKPALLIPVTASCSCNCHMCQTSEGGIPFLSPREDASVVLFG